VKILLIGMLLLAVVVLRRAYVATTTAGLREWAEVHGLELTAPSRPMVTWYLRTARVLRAWGAVAGLLLPTLIEGALGGPLRVLGFGSDGSGSPGAVVFILLGYLVGAFYAEIALRRRGGKAMRSASLVPRDIEDYLPSQVLWLQRGLGAAALVGAGLMGLVSVFEWGRGAERLSYPTLPAVLVWAGLVVAFTAGLEWVQRWLVRRPQPFVEPALVAADDAIRSQSVHSLAGSGIAVLLLQCGFLLIGFGAYAGPALAWALGVPGLVLCLSSAVACQLVGHRSWRVRRLAAAPAGPAPA